METPPPLCGSLSYVVFQLSAPLKIASEGPRWCRRLKKKTKAAYYSLLVVVGNGSGGCLGKNGQSNFILSLPPNRPSPTLFRSTAAAVDRIDKTLVLFI